MIEYTIIEGDSPIEVETRVNQHISEGWSLQGGISISESFGDYCDSTEHFYSYAQAMVREKP